MSARPPLWRADDSLRQSGVELRRVGLDGMYVIEAWSTDAGRVTVTVNSDELIELMRAIGGAPYWPTEGL